MVFLAGEDGAKSADHGVGPRGGGRGLLQHTGGVGGGAAPGAVGTVDGVRVLSAGGDHRASPQAPQKVRGAAGRGVQLRRAQTGQRHTRGGRGGGGSDEQRRGVSSANVVVED